MDRLMVREYREEMERLRSEVEDLQRRNMALRSLVRKVILEMDGQANGGEE